ncbi:MAG TPA: cbb3-type cytochrome oxidase assembly protein CcoS [Saprospiraceae bacterium]|nr:cbb3-type cytochrome oxidase assembly protein CcoS [Saprospiraceae bacterium]MCB9268330.1 cbb3-type cytochrome oxidase assembly protein CcoS [Lewinellaceae bacterium]HPG06240.1 cbb3-type cytochrome oxidase assembly protein CcoS [Saprospiraceae bacterium]HPR00287.1 cbb3-type cytochrome oxidase assembly protein CcoS [Saprospiraceae bacterium]HQU53037.1 cbb3-type cytochrome oxidase assembly protein CcoS [Saprospiraceae bacterium]
MGVIFLLIGISLIVAGGFLAAFFWAVRSGQYDDEYTPSVRILWDDKKPENSTSIDNNSTTVNKP